jgi:EAL and modified HD-GYP domain-containing signal transduction protein
MTAHAPAFINPLLGPDGAWSGYFVEFAPDKLDHETLRQLFNSPLIDAFDHRSLWLTPASSLESNASRFGERAIAVFPANPAVTDVEPLKTLEGTLRQAARKVALLASPERKLPGTGCWDYILLASSHARSLPLFALTGLSSRTTLISIDVHTHSDREWALENASSFSTSEYLRTRSSTNTTADITRIKLLKLLALIVEDAETDALGAIFREEQKLSYSLLRLVNSAAISPRSPITSFSQAINLLGRRQLQRWLQLLVYSDPNNGQSPNPLLQAAAARGRLLELLAPHLQSAAAEEHGGDLAFMIGTFSLLDVLLNIAMPELIKQLPLPDVAHKALAEHSGPLGALLAAIAAADRRDLPMASLKLTAHGIGAKDFLAAQLEAFSWAAKIRPLG